MIHWNLCKKFDLPCKETWYDHSPESVLENDQVKVLWDFKIQTDLHLDHNRPDIVVLEKKERVCYIIDVACPFDMRVLEKEQEKIDHYQDLKIEVQKVWSCRRVSVIPIIIEVLGTVSKNLKTWDDKIGLYGNTFFTSKGLLVGYSKDSEQSTGHLRLRDVA